MSLHPSKIRCSSRDKRKWSALHASPSYHGAVAGGIFRSGEVHGLNSRQARTLIGALGSRLVAVVSSAGDVLLGSIEVDERRADAFIQRSDFPSSRSKRAEPEVIDPPAPTEPPPVAVDPPAEDRSHGEDEATDGDAPQGDDGADTGEAGAAEFEEAKAEDFVETISESALRAMNKDAIAAWAAERDVEAPVELTKDQQVAAIKAGAGKRYRVA